MDIAHLFVHILPDLRCFSLPDLNATDVEGVDDRLYAWDVRSGSGCKCQDSKVGMMRCDVRQYGGVGVRSRGLVCLV